MIRFQTERIIDRPALAICSYAADISRHSEWMGVIDARLVSGQATDIGARGVERMQLGPRTFEVGEPANRASFSASRRRSRLAHATASPGSRPCRDSLTSEALQGLLTA